MKYLGFPLPKLETIYPIWAKGCRKIRDAVPCSNHEITNREDISANDQDKKDALCS